MAFRQMMLSHIVTGRLEHPNSTASAVRQDPVRSPVGEGPADAYAAAAALVTKAFAEDHVLDRAFYLPEIRDGGPYPAPMAIGFHFVDEVVHAWDLAKSIGAPVEFDDEVLGTALSIAARVLNDPATRGDGFAFALGVDSDLDAPTLDRIVTLLGRRPDWTPAR